LLAANNFFGSDVLPVAIDIVKRFAPGTSERTLFYITKASMFVGGLIALAIVLSGADFTSLVLTTNKVIRC
jgi:hypothetical protein